MNLNWKKISKITAAVVAILGTLGGGGYTIVDQTSTARANIKHLEEQVITNKGEIHNTRAKLVDIQNKVNWMYCYLRAQESGNKIDIDCLLGGGKK